MNLKEYLGTISPKQKLIFAILLGVIVLTGYWMLILNPLWQEKTRLTSTLDGLERELVQKQKIAAEKPKLEEEIKLLKSQLAVAVARLPEEKEIPKLLVQINTLGIENGLDFLTFRPGKSTVKDFYMEIPLQMKVETAYHSLGRFFDKIAKMQRIVGIGDVKIVPVSKKGDTTVTAEFNAITYTFVAAGAQQAQGATPQEKR